MLTNARWGAPGAELLVSQPLLTGVLLIYIKAEQMKHVTFCKPVGMVWDNVSTRLNKIYSNSLVLFRHFFAYHIFYTTTLFSSIYWHTRSNASLWCKDIWMYATTTSCPYTLNQIWKPIGYHKRSRASWREIGNPQCNTVLSLCNPLSLFFMKKFICLK